MEVGACGIACEVCAAFNNGACPGCVAGNGESALARLDAQRERLGSSCPILECAFGNRVGYCLRDCDKFPCEILYQGFPYSHDFLNIFKRV